MTEASVAAKRAELQKLSKAALIEKVLEKDREIHELTAQLRQQKNE